MSGQWLTYAELAVRLSTTPEAARQRAIRARWQRQPGNDGKARVLFDPDQSAPARTPNERPNEQPPERPGEHPLLEAMQAHIETLKAALLAAELKGERERERADKERDRADQERARVEEQSAELLRLVAAEMVARRERDESIDRASALASEIAALRGRPLWRRLVG